MQTLRSGNQPLITLSSPSSKVPLSEMRGQRQPINFLLDHYMKPETLADMLNGRVLIQLQNQFRRVCPRGADIQEFLAVFLNILSYPIDHQIHITSALIQLYRDVKDRSASKYIKWEEVTAFFVQNLREDSNFEQSIIPYKQKPDVNINMMETILKCKEVEDLAAVIIGRKQEQLRGIEQSRQLVDSFFHKNPIKEVQYMQKQNLLLSLDHLSDHVRIYDCINGRLTNSLKIKSQNHNQDAILLSIAWSNTEQRIGACCQDFSLAFWDVGDNFTYEKNFSLGQDVLQIMIKYIEFCSTWLTVDQLNRVNVLDIERETCETLKMPKYLQHVTKGKDGRFQTRKTKVFEQSNAYLEKLNSSKKRGPLSSCSENSIRHTSSSQNSVKNSNNNNQNIFFHSPQLSSQSPKNQGIQFTLHPMANQQRQQENNSSNSQFKETVTQICQLPQLRMIVIASLNKKLTFWNLPQRKLHRQISCGDVSLHSLAYSEDYSVLLSAGYQKSVGVWSFDSCKDPYFEGKLEGHVTQLTALQVVKQTPLALTADETGVLKSWDIRSFQCIQTIYLDSQFSLRKLMSVGPDLFIGAGKRLLWFKFQGREKKALSPSPSRLKNHPHCTQHHQKHLSYLHRKQNEQPPFTVEYNKNAKELVVATKTDVRIVDIQSGQTKKILAHFLKKQPDGTQITNMLLGARDKYLILSTSNGKIISYSYRNSRPHFVNQGHPGQDITSLHIDPIHRLVVSGSSGSLLKIQAEVTDGAPQVYRKSQSTHMGKDISLMKISTYLSLIATQSQGGVVFIWEYQFLKLLGACYQGGKFDLLCMLFIEPYKLLATSDDTGGVIVWDLTHDKRGFLTYPALFRIRLPSISGIEESVFSKFIHYSFKQNEFERNVTFDTPKLGQYNNQQILNSQTIEMWRQVSPSTARARIHCSVNNSVDTITQQLNQDPQLTSMSQDNSKTLSPSSSTGTGLDILYLGDAKGYLYAFCLTPLIQKYKIQPIAKPQYKREGYTAFKYAHLDGNGVFSTEEELYKLLKSRILDQKYPDGIASGRANRGMTRIKHRDPNTSSLFGSGFSAGVKDSNKLMNTNLSRTGGGGSTKDFSLNSGNKTRLEDIELLNIIQQEMSPVIKWKAHDMQISLLKIIKLPQLRIVSTSLQTRVIKIWSFVGSLLGSLNIDMPLPYKWDIGLNNKKLRFQKLNDALKYLKKVYQRSRLQKEIQKCGDNAEMLELKTGLTKRTSASYTNRQKIGLVYGIATTLKSCGFDVQEIDNSYEDSTSKRNIESQRVSSVNIVINDIEPEQSQNNRVPSMITQQDQNQPIQNNKSRQKIFKTEVSIKRKKKPKSSARKEKMLQLETLSDIEIAPRQQKNFKTMNQLFTHAKGQQDKLKKMDIKLTLKQIDVRQKVYLKEEQEDQAQKKISNAISNFKSTSGQKGGGDQQNSNKRGALVDCVYDKIIDMLNPSERYSDHEKIKKLQNELDSRIKKATALPVQKSQSSSGNYLGHSFAKQHGGSTFKQTPKVLRYSPSIRRKNSSIDQGSHIFQQQQHVGRDASTNRSGRQSGILTSSHMSMVTTPVNRVNQPSTFGQAVNLHRDIASLQRSKASETSSRVSQFKKDFQLVQIKQREMSFEKQKTKSIKKRPYSSIHNTKSRVDLNSDVLENQFGLQKGLINVKNQRSKLDWKEYSTLKQRRASLQSAAAMIRPMDLLNSPKAQAPAVSAAFITMPKSVQSPEISSSAKKILINENASSKIQMDFSSNKMFDRKYSQPILPSAQSLQQPPAMQRTPSCRQMLKIMDKKRLAFKLGFKDILMQRASSQQKSRSQLSPFQSIESKIELQYKKQLNEGSSKKINQVQKSQQKNIQLIKKGISLKKKLASVESRVFSKHKSEIQINSMKMNRDQRFQFLLPSIDDVIANSPSFKKGQLYRDSKGFQHQEINPNERVYDKADLKTKLTYNYLKKPTRQYTRIQSTGGNFSSVTTGRGITSSQGKKEIRSILSSPISQIHKY